MRAICVSAILAAAFVASAGSAQDMSMSNMAGVPMPDPAMDVEEANRAISERGHLGAIADARAMREQRTAWLEQQAAARRAEATAQAAALSSSTAADITTAASIRAALEEDLADWRKQFDVSRSEWRRMHDTWLPEGSFTAEEWATRRVEWFAARDAWIAAH